MGAQFCKPKYLENSIILNKQEISIDYIRKLLLIDALTNKEVAKVLSEKVNSNISINAIAKIISLYNIQLTEDVLKRRRENKSLKYKKTMQEKYGVDNIFQSEDIIKKIEATKLERYGDAHFVNREKAEQTCLEKYGVKNYSSTNECRQKVIDTNIIKYGTKTPAENTQIAEKMKKSCIDKYGVDNYWKSNIFKENQQQKYFEKYPNLTDLYKQSYKDPEKLRLVIEQLEDKTSHGIAEAFGISDDSARGLILKYNLEDLRETRTNTSHFEKEIAEYIGEDLCELNNRTILEGKEIDIYIPSKNLGIEFNGTYWHSSLFNNKNYHLDKSKLAESKGIRLIHIYEYEWADHKLQHKIKLMLDNALGRVNKKIYARQCEVREISNKEAKVLNESIHLQGHRDAQITYGLFYNETLVQLMSFSKTKYNKNLKTENSWEIIRGCPGSNCLVIGGVSKLLKHFIKTHNPSEIFSYCDFNKFNGSSYEAAGMTELGYTGPDMKWIMPNGEVISRNPKKHNELKKIAIAQIFGAGSKKYIWKKTQ